jgi:hypothetical protein
MGTRVKLQISALIKTVTFSWGEFTIFSDASLGSDVVDVKQALTSTTYASSLGDDS